MTKEIIWQLIAGVFAVLAWSFVMSLFVEGGFLFWVALGIAFYVATRGVYMIVNKLLKVKRKEKN